MLLGTYRACTGMAGRRHAFGWTARSCGRRSARDASSQPAMKARVAVKACLRLNAKCPRVRWLVWGRFLGSDDFQAKMHGHGIEIAIVVKQLMATFDAEGSDDRIDGLASRDAALA